MTGRIRSKERKPDVYRYGDRVLARKWLRVASTEQRKYIIKQFAQAEAARVAGQPADVIAAALLKWGQPLWLDPDSPPIGKPIWNDHPA